MMPPPSDKERADISDITAKRWQSAAAAWEARYAQAIERIEDLEQIILKLRECYKWDRNEYQSNKALVDQVEKAMEGVRKRE